MLFYYCVFLLFWDAQYKVGYWTFECLRCLKILKNTEKYLVQCSKEHEIMFGFIERVNFTQQFYGFKKYIWLVTRKGIIRLSHYSCVNELEDISLEYSVPYQLSFIFVKVFLSLWITFFLFSIKDVHA